MPRPSLQNVGLSNISLEWAPPYLGAGICKTQDAQVPERTQGAPGAGAWVPGQVGTGRDPGIYDAMPSPPVALSCTYC